MKQLREDSGTGPDLLASKILKKLAQVLAKPVALLVRIMLDTGCWPHCWKLHWIYPLHKRGARSLCKQYRGIHLTAQLSKVCERILSRYWAPYLEATLSYGTHQFAYIPNRGYRDALLFTVCSWLWALATKKRVGVYCSDVSGAFDRVDAERLIMKLRARGVHERVLKLLQSWLSDRTAHVCVEGIRSAAFVLSNMVFQGTVSGPSLWNSYYADANRAVESCEYTGTVFADDLNCFKVFDGSIGNRYIYSESKRCQQALHVWGRANRVVFEPAKESFHILDCRQPSGENFKMLSVPFDLKLSMHAAAVEFASVAGWRLKTLLRARRYYDTKALVGLYKSHILSFIEGATPALFHAAPNVLKLIDDIQGSFLQQLEVSQLAAFLEYNLAPLSLRRDIAMLGVLFKVSHKKAPPPVCALFKPYGRGALTAYRFVSAEVFHSFALHDPIEPTHPVMLKRSLFGLIAIYNRLPQELVEVESTQSFQRKLQRLARDAAVDGDAHWHLMFSCRKQTDM